jgi:outer membrane protein OmpA-like peptidoglycan-associated protein
VFENIEEILVMKTIKQLTIVLAIMGLFAAGCKSMNKTQKGAVIGAAGGGVVGGVVGRALGNTAAGVIVGATVGGVAGSVIGRKMDKQAEEMEKVLGDAEVKRVGEGIVIEFKENVLFGYDQSDLSAQAKTNLVKLANVLQKYPDTNIEVLGHTDDKGTDTYNQGLSERRATSAAAYLRNQGIADSRISTRGLGESDPKVSNDTDANRADNRRVEFVITANQKMIDDAKKESNN